jgi:methyl-accepting chemotaxis protein
MLDRIKLSGIDLRPKIIVAFVIVALLVGVTGGVGYYSVGTVDEKSHHIADDAHKMDATSEMILAVEKQQEAILHAQLGHTQMGEEMFTEGDDHFEEKGVSAFESYETSAAESQQLSSISELHDEYDAVAAEFFEAQAAGNTELAAEKAGRVAKRSRLCRWYSQLRGHS